MSAPGQPKAPFWLAVWMVILGLVGLAAWRAGMAMRSFMVRVSCVFNHRNLRVWGRFPVQLMQCLHGLVGQIGLWLVRLAMPKLKPGHG